MLNFPRWQIWAISLFCAIGVLLAIPSLLPASITGDNTRLPHINLGLDLAGGSQLLYEAETGSLDRQRVEALEDQVRAEARRLNIELAEVSTADNQLSFILRDPAQRDPMLEAIRALIGGGLMGGTVQWDVATPEPNRIILSPTAAGRTEAINEAMATAREVIDRRINALGTLEPTIIREGATRILVQVPGVQDPEAVKSLVGRTARLEFKVVPDEQPSQEVLASGRAPPGLQILPSREGGAIAVQRRALITGDQIAAAQQSYDQQGRPDVSITFDSNGGARFAKHTRENVGKLFAIVLDGTVISAPSINEPILGGRASISGGFTVAQANELAISLRSGRMPVELTVVDERTVSPELGRDSIEYGVIAAAIGSGLVILFMLATYGGFGVFAVIALMLNVLLILGWMALFNATLTLPGIAGFVLTVGAAVDANIIINERIREELRKGRTVLDSIDTGWKEASTAILDANVTNAIAGALMFLFGSGPIKGFAVVLIIGIITSAFTAITVARMMVAIWVRRRRPKTLVL
jgi:preprotein translocase subunit SecD